MPRALQYGVPYELFKHLNPRKLEPFKIAYENKQKEMNYYSWLNGLYVKSAIISCLSKDAKYPQEPFGTNDEENESEDDSTKTISDAEKFAMFALRFNKDNKLV